MHSQVKLARRIKLLLEDLRAYQPEKIILFGSAAKQDTDEYSDLDIVVIKRTSQRFVVRLIEAAKLLRHEVLPADIFVYTPEEFAEMKARKNPFIERVLKSGRVIYEASQRRR